MDARLKALPKKRNTKATSEDRMGSFQRCKIAKVLFFLFTSDLLMAFSRASDTMCVALAGGPF